MFNNDAFRRLIDPLKRKVLLSLARAVVKTIDDSKSIQRMQVLLLSDEVRDSVERFQEYGFTSVPQDGAEACVVFPSGNRSHGIIVAVDDRRYRLKGLQNGEVALYSDEGDKIVLKRGREIEVTTLTLTINASTSVDITAPITNITGNAKVTGALETTGNITGGAQISDITGTMDSMREIYNEHTHDENGDGGGTTDAPNQQMPE